MEATHSPEGGRLSRAAIRLALLALIALGVSNAWADTDWNHQFSQPQYLFHYLGHSTTEGYVDTSRDQNYGLYNVAPTGNVSVQADGSGGTINFTVEVVASGLNTPADVCNATAGLGIPSRIFTAWPDNFIFDCSEAAGASGEAPVPVEAKSWFQNLMDDWKSQSTVAKILEGLAATGALIFLNALVTALLGGTQIVLSGKMSTFGGPHDLPDSHGRGGVKADEGLALFDVSDAAKYTSLFLPQQPPGTTGAARRLNPNAYYIACRWNYDKTPRDYLRKINVTVTNPATGKSIKVQPVDWGPHGKTDRVADLSPGAAQALGLRTDQQCTVTIPLPAEQ